MYGVLPYYIKILSPPPPSTNNQKGNLLRDMLSGILIIILLLYFHQSEVRRMYKDLCEDKENNFNGFQFNEG